MDSPRHNFFIDIAMGVIVAGGFLAQVYIWMIINRLDKIIELLK